ncbi:unnamed protein product [Ambrosiozyma monospora]|uniref:Unnamed protein product n=1 Tax=Ambrosiozyma monospora TaxID=43982 RepID=A0ACB5T3W9_AMBMO|nr:unnamed protein product [Ambrosiozyma monospora]
MLSRAARSSRVLIPLKATQRSTSLRLLTSLKTTQLSNINTNTTSNIKSFRRFQSTLSKEPKTYTTTIGDEKDPNRSPFFDYTWGTWLKNDAQEKAKRRTEFSILGLNNTVSKLVETAQKPVDDKAKSVFEVEKNINGIRENLESLLKDFKFTNIKSMASMHEGKHHRLYKLELSTSEDPDAKDADTKEFVLRLPYNLQSSYYREVNLKSEVATLDFLSKKLELSVPRVLAYSSTPDNLIKSPFILMEYFEGNLLMHDWNPLVSGDLKDAEVKETLMKVIKPIAEFNKSVTDFNFDAFGSLYFTSDIAPDMKTLQEIDGRWRVGPTTERAYFKDKGLLTTDKLVPFLGPWPKDQPLAMVADLFKVELENFKTRLSVAKADLSVESTDRLSRAIGVYEKFLAVAPHLINVKSTTIPNLEELLKPKLALADLDPINVIQGENGNVFVDFEGSAIKPFILTNYPKFLVYTGPKIFNLKEEVEGWDDLDDVTKQQYEFMYNRTRNQFCWELALNDANKKLLGVISPAIKLIKAGYLEALNSSSDQDYLYVQNAIVELSQMWDSYVELGLIGEGAKKIEFDENELAQYEKEFEEYQTQISSTPFVATKGWVPQDMFNNLVKMGVVSKKENSDDYDIDPEKIM